MFKRTAETEVNRLLLTTIGVLLPAYYLIAVQELEVYVVAMLFVTFVLSELLKTYKRLEKITIKRFIFLSFILVLLLVFVMKIFIFENWIFVIGSGFSYLTYLVLVDPVEKGVFSNISGSNLAIVFRIRFIIMLFITLICGIIINYVTVFMVLKYTSYDVGILLKGFSSSIYFLMYSTGNMWRHTSRCMPRH